MFLMYDKKIVQEEKQKDHSQIEISMSFIRKNIYFGDNDRAFPISSSNNLCSLLRLNVRRNQLRKLFVTCL